MTRSEIAYEKFNEGYNCAQAVAVAFSDKLGMDEKTVAMLVSGFGGGIGGLHEVCGAVSGMTFVASVLKGYSDPKADTEKKETYALVKGLADKFKEKNESTICRELLGIYAKMENATAENRRVYCAELVKTAAEILEKEIL